MAGVLGIHFPSTGSGQAWASQCLWWAPAWATLGAKTGGAGTGCSSPSPTTGDVVAHPLSWPILLLVDPILARELAGCDSGVRQRPC